jgi:hypothetical protein
MSDAAQQHDGAQTSVTQTKINGIALQQNQHAMYTRRVVVAMASGAIAGALALQSLGGLLFFLVCNIVFSAVQLALLPPKTRCFVDRSWGVWTDNAVSGLLTYVLFWTLSFNLVHVF